MAEVRPWIGSYISVGYFSVAREIRVINFTTEDRRRQFFLGELPPEERNKEVWASIDRAFALPASRTDDTAEYVATQIIAETFKGHGLDGIRYQSSIGDGHNIALFDIGAAHLVRCQLFDTRKLQFTFEEIAKVFYVTDQATDTGPDDS